MTKKEAVGKVMESLTKQLGNKALLTTADYAQVFSISRRAVPKHIRSRQIPHFKDRETIYINTIDLAEYLARVQAEQRGELLLDPIDYDKEMRRRRGGCHKATAT